MFINFNWILPRFRALEDRHSTLGIGDSAHISDDIPFEEHEIVPHFQRVSISGEDTSGVPLEDLEHASSLLIEALEIRERYMSLSMQSFPQTTERFLKSCKYITVLSFVNSQLNDYFSCPLFFSSQ